MPASTADELEALRDAVAGATAVTPVGGRTHWEVGGPPPRGCVEVHAPAGIVAYDPAELTVTVGAGTTVEELQSVLGEAGQECVLDPSDVRATVGGTIASGLSGHRRLRYGPVRDRVLEVRLVTADGRLVKGGGPTVKNVSGYDLPRLLVGSLGTIAVITRVTLRCQPRPQQSLWARAAGDPVAVRRRCLRPSCIAWDGRTATVLVEGHPDDVTAELAAGELTPVDGPPPRPAGAHRGRISVRPRHLRRLAEELDATGVVRWSGEIGVGTVHIATDDAEALARARRAAHAAGGWMLREAGGGGLDGFGCGLPNQAIMNRLKAAFDPGAKLSPGRLPR